jgi:hypothetical protein
MSALGAILGEIGDLMPAVLLAELQEQGAAVPDAAVVAQAQRNVRAGWSADGRHAVSP